MQSHDCTSCDTARVTIVICTTGAPHRSQHLLRAIDSIFRNDLAETIRVCVVVNGGMYDPETVHSISQRSGVSVIQVPLPSFTNALRVGRAAVHSEYFGFLDDDDEYLPHAIDHRVSILDSNPSLDLVVTNGVRSFKGIESVAFKDLPSAHADPLRSLFKENWLASCGGLFRTASVHEYYFQNITNHLEWTWIAYRLAMDGKKLAALDVPTFRIHDTADSASKSDAYRAAFLTVGPRMLELSPPQAIARQIHKRLGSTLHNQAALHIARTRPGDAWSAHLKSLMQPSGLRYFFYTVRLCADTLRIVAARVFARVNGGTFRD